MLLEMPLHELRQARGLSQKMLAEVLNVQQPSIAKMEKRTDMYLSTLRSHIEAMGGELDIIARFLDGAVKINQQLHGVGVNDLSNWLDLNATGYLLFIRHHRQLSFGFAGVWPSANGGWGILGRQIRANR